MVSRAACTWECVWELLVAREASVGWSSRWDLGFHQPMDSQRLVLSQTDSPERRNSARIAASQSKALVFDPVDNSLYLNLHYHFLDASFRRHHS